MLYDLNEEDKITYKQTWEIRSRRVGERIGSG